VTRSRAVPTPYGDGRLDVHAAREATVTLLLSHGAGNGVESRDLVALAAALPRHGVSVALFEQPWRVAGRRTASPPPTLDVGLRAARGLLRPRGPLVVGGRSAGARSAARCATQLGADGCLALSFPLHPPGRPEKSRVDELTGAVVPAADHGLRVPAAGPLSQAEALEVVVEAVLEWLVREVTGNP
jgi:predicted alpha/beta-hydrolase family hydrolase